MIHLMAQTSNSKRSSTRYKLFFFSVFIEATVLLGAIHALETTSLVLHGDVHPLSPSVHYTVIIL